MLKAIIMAFGIVLMLPLQLAYLLLSLVVFTVLSPVVYYRLNREVKIYQNILSFWFNGMFHVLARAADNFMWNIHVTKCEFAKTVAR